MADSTGESKSEPLRLDFDRRLMLRFLGSVITSDGRLLAYRELDDAVGLTDIGADRSPMRVPARTDAPYWAACYASRCLAGSLATRT